MALRNAPVGVLLLHDEGGLHGVRIEVDLHDARDIARSADRVDDRLVEAVDCGNDVCVLLVGVGVLEEVGMFVEAGLYTSHVLVVDELTFF